MTNALLAIATNALMALAGTNDWMGDVAYLGTTNTLSSSLSDGCVTVYLDHGGRLVGPTETVSVVTNVVTETGKPCEGCAMWGIQQGDTFIPGHEYNCPEKDLPRDTKRETTEVVEVRTLRFRWDGQDEAVEHRRVLSSKVRRWVKRDEWVEGEP
jgi:hypothetical protein